MYNKKEMTTTNIELEQMAKKLSIPLVGIFSKNDLPMLNNRKEGSYIINLEDDTDINGNYNNGTHWVCLYIEKDSAVYYDSYGIIFPRQVKEFCKGLHLIYNHKQQQFLTSEMCGYFVLLFLYFMTHNKKFGKLENRMNMFQKLFDYKNLKKNDEHLKNHLKRIGLVSKK